MKTVLLRSYAQPWTAPLRRFWVRADLKWRNPGLEVLLEYGFAHDAIQYPPFPPAALEML
jgi:hypothetical protein